MCNHDSYNSIVQTFVISWNNCCNSCFCSPLSLTSSLEPLSSTLACLGATGERIKHRQSTLGQKVERAKGGGGGGGVRQQGDRLAFTANGDRQKPLPPSRRTEDGQELPHQEGAATSNSHRTTWTLGGAATLGMTEKKDPPHIYSRKKWCFYGTDRGHRIPGQQKEIWAIRPLTDRPTIFTERIEGTTSLVIKKLCNYITK